MAPRRKGKTPKEDPKVLTIAVTDELRDLNAVARLRAIASNGGWKPSQAIRALLILGIATAERDPAALANAGLLAREAG